MIKLFYSVWSTLVNEKYVNIMQKYGLKKSNMYLKPI